MTGLFVDIDLFSLRLNALDGPARQSDILVRVVLASCFNCHDKIGLEWGKAAQDMQRSQRVKHSFEAYASNH